MAAIVHNSGVNYTLYYNILDYFKTIMDNHPSIQLVTQGLIQDFDTREFPQYPIGNVSILSCQYLETVTSWEIQLTIADKIKNKNNESDSTSNKQEIPFYGVDDVVDIHANTLAIINDLTSFTQKSVDGLDIPDLILNEPFEDRFNNGLAGWVSTFTVTVHNNRDRCIFPLLVSPTTTTTLSPTTSTTTIQPTTTSTTTVQPTTSTTTQAVYQYYSNRTETNGFNNEQCVNTGSAFECIYPIYTTISSLSGYICESTTLYSDITLTTPWDGLSEWFGLSSTPSGSAEWYYPIYSSGIVSCPFAPINPIQCL